jgi:pilus assembly protein CpaE
MQSEILSIGILYGTGTPQPALSEVVQSLPQLQVAGQACNPEEFLRQPSDSAPDSLLVYLDGEHAPPEWLEHLTLGFPQTAVLVCSHRREPDFLIRAMQLGVREFLPLPLARTDLEGALERVRTAKRRLAAVPATRGRIVALTGHKGGAGATTVAINLAAALAELQAGPVALVDLGRPFPDIGNFLDQEAPYGIGDLIQNLNNLDQAFIQKIMVPYDNNLAILHGVSVKNQDSLDWEALDRVFVNLRTMYKWIIVDLSHWIDEFFAKVIEEADLALVLTELTVPDLRNLGHIWRVFREMSVGQKDKIKIVINRHHSANGLSARDLEHLIQKKVYFTLPSDYQALMEAVNQGVPLAKVAPRSKLCRSLQDLARELLKLDGDNMQAGSDNGTGPARRFFKVFKRKE